MATRDPIDDTELATRLKESREDVFEELQDSESNITDAAEGIAFQEFSRRIGEKREGKAGIPSDESASIAVLNEIGTARDVTLRRRDQRTVETTSRDLFSARKYQEDKRSREAIARDRATNAETVTGDFERWKSQPGQLDFPGIDTRGNIGPQLAGAEQSAQTAAETPGQRESNIAADNNDRVLLDSQAAAGVDDDDLNREVLFGAAAEAEDVSLSPGEGFDRVGSGEMFGETRSKATSPPEMSDANPDGFDADSVLRRELPGASSNGGGR